MIVSHSWLRSYAPHDLDPQALADLITRQCCPVESVEAVGEGDSALELEVTWNRSDLLSHVGVAREVAAGTGCPVTIPPAEPAETPDRRAADEVQVRVDAPDLCPRYTARVLRGVKVGPSPVWLRERLEAIGVRPVNNVVDVTNFVLHECGQPLHAFDLKTIEGPEIIVRRGARGETMTAIDGSELTLTEETLVIADARRPVAIAGIMGGLDTEITERTTDVLLESAYFDPVATRRASRRLGLSSDSSSRFSHGVDPESIDWASRRVSLLVMEIAGGTLSGGMVDVDAGTLPGPQTLCLRHARLAQVAGFEIPEAEAIAALRALGMAVKPLEKKLEVVVPPARREVAREIDLIEEVLRVYGYDRVPEATALPIAVVSPQPRERQIALTRDVLVGAGFREIHSVSFVPADDLWDPPLFSPFPARQITNPVREETPALRRSLFGPLLEAKRTNLDRGARHLRLFEISTVYLPYAEAGVRVTERQMLGLLGDDACWETAWASKPDESLWAKERLAQACTHGRAFLGVRGAIDAVARALGVSADRLAVEPAPRKQSPVNSDGAIFHPVDRAGAFEPPEVAHLILREGPGVCGTPIGWLGRVSEAVAGRFDLGAQRPVLALLDLDALLDVAAPQRRFQPISAYPSVARDLAVVVEQATYGSIRDVVLALRTAHPVLQKVELLSVFRGDGKSLPTGQRSVAIRLTCQAPDRTLTGDEADRVREAAKTALAAQLKASFRE